MPFYHFLASRDLGRWVELPDTRHLKVDTQSSFLYWTKGVCCFVVGSELMLCKLVIDTRKGV